MLKTRIYEIDALRGFACLMVVFNHYGVYGQMSGLGLNVGCVGVDLFFIISGFVISLTIEQDFSWKHFLINRFSRLFPSYWFCLILSAFAIVLSYPYIDEPAPTSDFYETFLANTTMFQFYLNYPNIDGSYWTLIIELLFYAFIFIFLLLKKKHLIEIIGGIFLLFPLCLIIFYKEIVANEPVYYYISKTPLLPYFPLFYSGIIFYKLKFEKKDNVRWGMIVLCFILQLLMFDKFYSNGPELSITQYSCTLFVIYVCFVLYIHNKLSFIVNKYTVWLGGISYCLYLIHQSIGVRIILPFLHYHLHINFWVAFVISFLAVLGLAYGVTNYIEKPGIKLIRKKYSLKIVIR